MSAREVQQVRVALEPLAGFGVPVEALDAAAERAVQRLAASSLQGEGGGRTEVTEDEGGQQWYIGSHVTDDQARHALLGYLLTEADLPSEEAWSLAGTARVSRGWYRYVRPNDDGMVPCEPEAEGATAITSIVEDVVEGDPWPRPPTGVQVDREALREAVARVLESRLTDDAALRCADQLLDGPLAPLLGIR